MNLTNAEDKYARVPYPVVVTDHGGMIVFLNEAAKKNFKSVKININIGLALDNSGLKTMKEIADTGEAAAVEIKTAPSVRGSSERASGLAIPEKIGDTEYITFLFGPPFGIIGGKSTYEKEIKRILDVYNKEKSSRLNNILFNGNNAGLKEVCDNYKKIVKIDKYINFCMQELLNDGKSSTVMQIRDATDDLLHLKEVLNKYIVAQGYKIRYIFDDKLFYLKYNGWDFFMVNAIAASFALRNSADKRIDYIFKLDNLSGARIDIVFTPPQKVFDYFTNSMLMDITKFGTDSSADINYFDLYLAHIVAANNNILMSLSPEENKIKLALEMRKSGDTSLEAGRPVKDWRYASELEKYRQMLAEFILSDFTGS